MLLLLLSIFTADQRIDVGLDDARSDDVALSAAIQQLTPGDTLRIGPGVLILERYPAELRHVTGQPNKRLDVTIRGTPGDTVIRGIGKPHDVLQLNAVAGITLRDLIVESHSNVSGGSVGCNGVSITNGTANVLCDNVVVRGLPVVYAKDRFDGGKAFTVQQAAGNDRSDNITFRGCSAIDCPTAFGVDAAPDRGAPGVIVIDRSDVRDCVAGVAVSFSAAKDMPTGFRVDVIGCRMTDVRRPLIVSRACDIRFIGNSVSTVRVPDMPDPWQTNFGDCAVAVKGAVRVEITGNTFVDRRPMPYISVTSATGPHQASAGVVIEPNVMSR